MTFPPQFLDEIRARIPLEGVIGKRVRLLRRGRELLGLCPFHKEKTPSFTVNEDKGFFHCFGCGAHGDVIGFIMRDEGLSFPEAVERLAGDAGLAMPARDPRAEATGAGAPLALRRGGGCGCLVRGGACGAAWRGRPALSGGPRRGRGNPRPLPPRLRARQPHGAPRQAGARRCHRGDDAGRRPRHRTGG